MTTWTPTDILSLLSYLLTEDGKYLTQENTGKIVLDQSTIFVATDKSS